MDHCDKHLGGADCPYHYHQQQLSSVDQTSHILVQHNLDIPRAELHVRDN